ncbi:helicase-related protein, partial [bacterium]|nr:helicase-related protein [bacterium]
MSEKQQLTLLKNSTEFNSIFSKLIVNDGTISAKDKEYILLCALLFLKVYNEDSRYRSYFKIGYYIILKYSLLFSDYRPLFEISIQIGFYPICKTMLNQELVTIESISELISYNIINKKFNNSREGYLETLEQNISGRDLLISPSKNLLYIAPTSFGKSSLIKDFILKGDYNKIGIIVPTKSLLVQTYKDIKALNLNYKLITHDEMYNGEERFISVLTQERATRMLRRNVAFDILFIDEAHNIFRYNKKNSRGILLARLIKGNLALNNRQKVIYLSPLIDDPQNIRLETNSEITSAKVMHNLKSEDLFLLKEQRVSMYNRFTNEYIDIKQNVEFMEYILSNSESKNFIYNFRPIKIEELAKELFENLTEVLDESKINLIISTLTSEVHENFYVNKYIKKGIVYIHGKIPNQIKEYLEYKFKTITSLRYIIANKVILEGINLPIDTIFITSTAYLDGKDLVNLIGRVNRLNVVFQENNLNKLNPKIHFLDLPRYQGSYSMSNKIELLRNHSFKDKIQNPLLSSYDIDKLDFAKTEFLSKEQVKER